MVVDKSPLHSLTTVLSADADMALRIEKGFGAEMGHHLRMQLAFDVAKTREQEWAISIKGYAQA